MSFYLEEGRRLRGVVQAMLPADWSWSGKQALDFGCGAGRVLRHFADEAAAGAVFAGCDIDGPSIEWACANLAPPFRFLQNGLEPPLPLATGSLDLVWAMSVFTHITDAWAAWLVEMHRLLAPGGILVASFLGEGMWEPLVGSSYVEDQVGMAVLHRWDGPNAWVFHSEWWLREHWGRGFEIQQMLRPSRSVSGQAEVTHSYVALRKREVKLSPEVVTRIDPREGRELAGLRTALELANHDIEHLVAQQGEPVGRRRARWGLRRAARSAFSASRVGLSFRRAARSRFRNRPGPS